MIKLKITLAALILSSMTFAQDTPQWDLQEDFILQNSYDHWGLAMDNTDKLLLNRMKYTGASVCNINGSLQQSAPSYSRFADAAQNDTAIFYADPFNPQIVIVQTFDGIINPTEPFAFNDTISVPFLNATEGIICLALNNTNGNFWIATAPVPGSLTGGAPSNSAIYEINNNGVLLRTITTAAHGLNNMRGFAYYANGGDESLWITSGDLLIEFDLATETVITEKDFSYLATNVTNELESNTNTEDGLTGLTIIEDLYESGVSTLGLVAYSQRCVFFNVANMAQINPDAGINGYGTSYEENVSSTAPLAFTLKNHGNQNLTTVDVAYTVNGMTLGTENFVLTSPLLPGQTVDLEYSTVWNSTSYIGTEIELGFVSSNPNGGLDDDNNNDSYTRTVLVGTAVSGHRRVLIESNIQPDNSSAWGGLLPREIITLNPIYDEDYTMVNIHRSGNSFGFLGILATNPIAQMMGGHPRSVFNRSLSDTPNGNRYSVGTYGNPYLEYKQALDEHKDKLTPCDISIAGEITSNSDKINVTITTNFVDYSPNGNRIGLYITEDNIDGDPDNDYTVRLTLPMSADENGDLVYNWGDQTIPNNPEPGSSYTVTFNDIELDASWDPTKIKVVAYVSEFDDNDPDNDEESRKVLNSNWGPISDFTVVEELTEGIGFEENELGRVEIYPNPNNGQFNVAFENDSGSNVTIELLDLTGRVVYSESETTAKVISMNPTHLTQGTYLVRITSNNSTITKRVTIK